MAKLLAFFAFVTFALANDCSVTPIFVDIHTRVIDGGSSYQYGTFIGVGTPSQNQSLWPSIAHNETTFADSGFCQQSQAFNCSTRTHGIYINELSQTYRDVPSYHVLDSEDDQVSSTVSEIGTDTLNIYTHYFDPSPPNVTNIEKFPVTVLTNYSLNTNPWFGPAGLVGLGPSSTVLQHLYDSKLISSRSWGLYLGTGYGRAGGAVNGSLVLGGYDSGRFNQQPVQFDLSSATTRASPFKVQVKNITLNNLKTKVVTELLDSPFEAYLTTSQYDLSLPQDVTQKFVAATKATPANNDDSSLALPANFNGTLTVELNNGVSVSFPSEWLKNASNISPISAASLNASTNATTPSSTPFLLGSSFLSYLYLIANYDSTPPSFFLTPATLDGPYVATQPLCPNTVPEPAKPISINHFAGAGLTGAIVAGVVGGIGLSFVAWWAFRKYMRYRSSRSNKPFSEPEDKSKPRSNSVSDASSYESHRGEDTEMATFTFYLPKHERSDIPFTPQTPMPLLGNMTNERTSTPSPGPGSTPGHSRTPSRLKMNLSVKTDFEPPPKSKSAAVAAAAATADFGVAGSERKSNRTKIKRHPVSTPKHKALRRIFPA